MQIATSETNTTGICIMFTVTTITQVHAIHISYFAFYETNLNLVRGIYIYDAAVNGVIEHIP